jgi:CHAT domain/Mucin-2 protein WxxW repeating region
MGKAMRYADLEIRIHARKGEGYPVELTLDRDLEYGPGSLSTSELPWTPAADPIVDGQRLFEWLFADLRLRAAWSEIRGRHPQRRIRLRISSEAPEVHAVPWELLSDLDSATIQPLAAAQSTPFSRYLAGKWQPGEAIVKRPLQVLVVIANPAGLDAYELPPVDIETEANLLHEATDGLEIELTFLPPPCTLSAIEKALRHGGYHVLHFFAHGAFDRESDSAALFLADTNNQVALAVDQEVAAMLARQLADIDTQRQDKLRLVFLESCQTATRSPADAFRGFAPHLVAAGVPAVVAMQDQVPFVTAREFAETFYRRLLDHGQVDLAANEARSAILTGNLPGAAIPVLFQRLRSGLLLGRPLMDAEEILDEPGVGPDKAPERADLPATQIAASLQPQQEPASDEGALAAEVEELLLGEGHQKPRRLNRRAVAIELAVLVIVVILWIWAKRPSPGPPLTPPVPVSSGSSATNETLPEWIWNPDQPPPLPASWTPWLNRDLPSGSGDYEGLRDFVEAGQVCANPLQIECRLAGPEQLVQTGLVNGKEKYLCDLDVGGVCDNRQQSPGVSCSNYEVRFLCP